MNVSPGFAQPQLHSPRLYILKPRNRQYRLRHKGRRSFTRCVNKVKPCSEGLDCQLAGLPQAIARVTRRTSACGGPQESCKASRHLQTPPGTPNQLQEPHIVPGGPQGSRRASRHLQTPHIVPGGPQRSRRASRHLQAPISCGGLQESRRASTVGPLKNWGEEQPLPVRVDTLGPKLCPNIASMKQLTSHNQSGK